MKKGRWFIAAVICFVVWGATLKETPLTQRIEQAIYSNIGLSLAQLPFDQLLQPSNKKIEVTSSEQTEQLLDFESVTPTGKGFLLTFNKALPIASLQNGTVVFTGHMKETGKTLSIRYDEQTTVTYGNLDQFSVLPYTTVSQGEVLALKQQGDLYIEVEHQGQQLDLQQTLQWLQQQQ